MKKVKVTRRMLEAYVNKLINEADFESPMVTPTIVPVLDDFTYVSGGTITNSFVPGLAQAISKGGTDFGNIGEDIAQDLDRFFPGQYRINLINNVIDLGQGPHMIRIGGSNFVNSDLCFTRVDGKIFEYDETTGALKIDIALISAKLSFSAVGGGGPLANPFKFEKFDKVIYEVIAAAMRSDFYQNKIVGKGITPKAFLLKAGGLCGNFYAYPQSDGFNSTADIPSDHEKKLRYVFYSLDPVQNFNVQVIPQTSSTGAPVVPQIEIAQRSRDVTGRGRGSTAVDYSHDRYKRLRGLAARYIRESWDAHVTNGKRSTFVDATNYISHFQKILNTNNTPGYGPFPPLTRTVKANRGETAAADGAAVVLNRTTSGANPGPKFSLVTSNGRPKSVANKADFLAALGLSNTDNINELPAAVMTAYPDFEQQLMRNDKYNKFGTKMMIFYKVVLACFSDTVVNKSAALLDEQNDVIFVSSTPPGTEFTPSDLTPNTDSRGAISFSNFQILNSRGASYISGDTGTLASAQDAYYSCITKEYKLEFDHSSTGIMKKIVDHIKINHPNYTYSAVPQDTKRFDVTTGGNRQEIQNVPGGAIQSSVDEVEDFIKELKKQIKVRQGQSLQPGDREDRRVNLSNFLFLLNTSESAKNLFFSMMTALRSLEPKKPDPRNPTAYQKIMQQLRRSTAFAQNLATVQRLATAANSSAIMEQIGEIGEFDLVELVQIFLPDTTVLENIMINLPSSITGEEPITVGDVEIDNLESRALIPALKCELVFAAADMPQKGEAFEALNNISNAVLDIFKENANITAEPSRALIQQEDPPEESNISLVPELPPPANQPFPEPALAVAESRLYESILLDLMEATAKKQRAANRPKKIKITRRQLRHLIEKQTK